jgi:hypothetical protein
MDLTSAATSMLPITPCPVLVFGAGEGGGLPPRGR